MIVYHGSNSRFKQLRISKSLVKSDISQLSEGLGIYFSTYYDVAKSYGKYVYSIEINSDDLMDFTNRQVCKTFIYNLVKYVLYKTGIDLGYFINLKIIINGMVDRRYEIYLVGKEIELWLDSNENWYTSGAYEKSENVHKAMERYFKENLKVYMFNYEIRGVGIIKDVKYAKIVSR